MPIVLKAINELVIIMGDCIFAILMKSCSITRNALLNRKRLKTKMSRHEGKNKLGDNARFSYFWFLLTWAFDYRQIRINSVYYGPTPPNCRNLSTIFEPLFPNSKFHGSLCDNDKENFVKLTVLIFRWCS